MTGERPDATNERHRFQVDLLGILELLSGHLYSSPRVFLRELLQNAVDALEARRGVQPDHEGTVSVEVVQRGDEPPTLLFEDDGIGLTEEEVHEFLAKIGRSSKRSDLEHVREAFLGQFGIGILSCFLVSDEIVMITRSAATDAPALEWRGRADGTYAVRVLAGATTPGTRVFLRAKRGFEEHFEPEVVREQLRRYGGLLPHPILFRRDGREASLNEGRPAFLDLSGIDAEDVAVSGGVPGADRDALLAFGRDLFHEEFLDAIPLGSESGGVRGVAFVLPRAASLSSRRAHRVYLKGMLLSESAENILPDWAFFVRAAVDTWHLRPTASREEFYEDARLEATRRELGECLRRYLVRLARTDPVALERLVDVHELPMKALAVDDDDFYRLFFRWLPMKTSLGSMSLDQIRRHDRGVRYTGTVDQFRQIAGVASAGGLCVVNGGYTYDSELVERLPMVDPAVTVERIDATAVATAFREPRGAEREDARRLEEACESILSRFGCRARVRRFEPSEIGALYAADEQARFLRSVESSREVADDLWSSVLDDVARRALEGAQSILYLNWANAVVRKTARIEDGDTLAKAIETLYVQALLLGHHSLGPEEMALLNAGLVYWIDRGLGAS